MLEKKVNVNTRVKNGSKDDGPTALHIAASYGHKDIVEKLLKDNRVNPSLKSKNKTSRDMVENMIGTIPSRPAIIEMLKEAEESYRTKPQKKAKNLNIKLQDGSIYRLSQSSHGILSNSTVNENNVLENDIDSHSEQYGSTCSNESGSDDSGLESGQLETISNTSSHFEINHDGANHAEENVDNQAPGNALQPYKEEIQKLKVQLKKLCVQLRDEQEGNKSLKQKIQDLENENSMLNSELDKTKTQTNEVSLEKAQKELAELKNYVAGHETRLEALDELNEENLSLKQKIQDLENENITLSSGLEKSKTNKVPLEKAEKRPLFSRITYMSLIATSIVGSILSIASGLFVLSIIATSVTSALVAAYTMSQPTTELKEADIQNQQHGKLDL